MTAPPFSWAMKMNGRETETTSRTSKESSQSASDVSEKTSFLEKVKMHLTIFLNEPFPASFSLFSSFLQTFNSKRLLNKSYWWLDSNPGFLVSEATALSTVPQPLPNIQLLLYSVLSIGSWRLNLCRKLTTTFVESFYSYNLLRQVSEILHEIGSWAMPNIKPFRVETRRLG